MPEENQGSVAWLATLVLNSDLKSPYLMHFTHFYFCFAKELFIEKIGLLAIPYVKRLKLQGKRTYILENEAILPSETTVMIQQLCS